MFGADILPGTTLPVEARSHIGCVTIMTPLHDLLVLGQYYTPCSKLLLTQVNFLIYGEV